jgi:hypothetical protein
MRVTVGFLFVLCAGVMTRALAGDPTPPPPSPTPSATTAPASAAPQSATAPAAADSSAAKPAEVAAADVEKEKATVDAKDKELKSRGYKMQMRNGEKWFCRREAPMGSRLEVMECNTAESIYAKEASSQEMVRRMQIYSPKVSN